MEPRRIWNPSNPYLSEHRDWIGEPPAAELAVYEDASKSILSRNDSPDLGFRWSLNPYRGCFHACSYCVSGDTPILMADGRTNPIADIRVGDEIYGTVWRDPYRRYVRTRVLAHWSTVKPAYRIVLEDGTKLVASADHRFLTNRGWKYVTGSEQGRTRRPHMTLTDTLLAVDPAITRKKDISGQAIKNQARLRVTAIEPLGLELPMFDITTGTGDFIANGVVNHNCYARPTHEYFGFGAGTDFERKIFVKPRAPQLLEAALSKPSWRRERIM
ncbi:MAG: radical SAM protein, partial [Candidatus Omnitrophica bacterium]|nr:radical SAM protein [Candidatus Omnitrophota bacterium]